MALNLPMNLLQNTLPRLAPPTTRHVVQTVFATPFQCSTPVVAAEPGVAAGGRRGSAARQAAVSHRAYRAALAELQVRLPATVRESTAHYIADKKEYRLRLRRRTSGRDVPQQEVISR
jgi:hypothetical protein